MEPGGAAGAASAAPWTPPFCTIVDADTRDFSYRACSLCERPLPDLGGPCSACSRRTPSAPPSRRFFRLLLSVATADKVVAVVCFDRAARVLLGCSADELRRLCEAHPDAAHRVREALQGEMCWMSLRPSKKGTAEHLHVAAVRPLRTGFRPVIEALRSVYGQAERG